MTEEEIITSVEVTEGSSDDGKQFKTLLHQTLEAGIEVNEIIGDTAYSGKDNLAEMKSAVLGEASWHMFNISS